MYMSQVLAVLYVLGKGNSFDDVSQMSRLSVPTVQRIFHAFMERYATDLYATTVVKPTGQALADTMKDFDAAGFPGAVGSTAVTHLHWQHAPYSGRQSYLGREGLPTLAYECTVDRSGRCLAATKGMPGAQSDSAIACSDEFVKEVRDGDYKDMEFTLKGENGEDVKEKGLWLLAGGEHHLVRQRRFRSAPHPVQNFHDFFSFSNRPTILNAFSGGKVLGQQVAFHLGRRHVSPSFNSSDRSKAPFQTILQPEYCGRGFPFARLGRRLVPLKMDCKTNAGDSQRFPRAV